MKRLLFLTHRWAGVGLALFMSLWFLSGLVIVYSSPMTQNRAQQWARAEPLQAAANWLSLGEAWRNSAAARDELAPEKAGKGEAGIVEARLLRQDGVPVWLVEDSRGQRFALSGIDGSLRRTSPEQARCLARQWVAANGGEAPPAVSFVETLDQPVILRNQDGYKPFHRIAVADGRGGELLISARTGEVIHASNALERGMYWAGNWLHLFRFLDLAGLGDSRTDVLQWLAGAALAATLTGLVVGWLRWRPGWFGKATYAEGRVHPYKAAWFRWHFWAGLLGGLLALTWTLSAFFNGNPWQLFSPAAPNRGELARYVGQAQPAAMRDWQPTTVADALGPEVVEVAWRHLGEQAVLSAYQCDGERFIPGGGAERVADAVLLAAVQRLAGERGIAGSTLQTEYDSYYYPRHGRAAIDRPLPVVRVDFDDAVGTRVYVDPQDGRLLLRQDRSRRVYRWLWSALHHWDFGWLYQRPLWDAWMLTWIGFGLVLSVSSVVLGWRRLGLSFRRKAKAPAGKPLLAAESSAG